METLSRSRGDVLITASTVQDQLQALANQARDAGLSGPSTKAVLSLNADELYLESLPQLVDLIDQADRFPALAASAALLLSEIGAQEALRPVPGLDEKTAPPPFESVEQEYLKHFDTLVVRSRYTSQVAWHADRLIKNRARYEAVTSATGVPWYVVGVIHALEASFHFLAHLHNGDVPLDQVTRHVPANRPHPWNAPFTWERSAIDAMRYEQFADLEDWSLARTLYRLEQFNGFGYRSHGINSPYLWSFSQHYTSGKYVEDGIWSPTAVSQQCGAALMLHELKRRGT